MANFVPDCLEAIVDFGIELGRLGDTIQNPLGAMSVQAGRTVTGQEVKADYHLLNLQGIVEHMVQTCPQVENQMRPDATFRQLQQELARLRDPKKGWRDQAQQTNERDIDALRDIVGTWLEEMTLLPGSGQSASAWRDKKEVAVRNSPGGRRKWSGGQWVTSVTV